MSFLQASVYLWLNYHTVHHMFPRIDFAHHPGLQQILFQTCEEHNVQYVTGDFLPIYSSMIRSFTTPSSLYKEIMVYSGGI